MSVVLLSEASKIALENGQLLVNKEEEKIHISTEDISALIIESLQVSLTPSAIIYLTEHSVPLIMCNKKHQPQVFCMDMFHHYEVARKIHEQQSWTEIKKVKAWRDIITVKIFHQYSLLKAIKPMNKNLDKLATYVKQVKNCTSLEDINAIEAIGARIYFISVFGENFKRKEDSVINSGLNYGYGVLRAYISTLVVAKGLHPSLGICHKSTLNAFNLVDDIIEIFRPLVDYAVCIKYEEELELSNEFRKHLLKILSQEILYQGMAVSLKRGIELFIDNFIDYFNSDVELHLPRLEVSKYEF